MSTPSPESLLALARAFQESRVLLTAAELDLFSLLAASPRPLEEVEERIGADRRGLSILLDALAAMGLLEKTREGYRTAPSVAPWLVRSGRESVLPMIRHAARLWGRWSRLTNQVVPGADEKGLDASSTEDFIGAMHVVASPGAARIVEAAGASGSRRLLDVGGGPGTYTEAFLRAVPEMTATLFDLPDVVEIARPRLEAAGLGDRIRFVGGDLRTDPLPEGHDLAFVSAIVHMLGLDECEELYAKVREALAPGGRILIHVMEPDRTRPRAGALFAVNMLCGTARGGTYTLEEIGGGLEKAGFTGVRLLQTGERMEGLVEAFRP